MVSRRLDELGDGREFAQKEWESEEVRRLRGGLETDTWLKMAGEEMERVFRAVSAKGRLGGILRRESYHRRFTTTEKLARAIEAIQTVTQRLPQSALSVKSGEGARPFRVRSYFLNPSDPLMKEEIAKLDSTIDADLLGVHLAGGVQPTGLLRLLATPSWETILSQVSHPDARPESCTTDPRLAWYLQTE